MKLEIPSQEFLYLDIECRPLSWYGGEWVTKDVTVVSVSWGDHPLVTTWSYGSAYEQETMLATTQYLLSTPDIIVVGHFIRGFDLPVLNGALMEAGLPPLPQMMTVDTKLDLIKRSGQSNSQENLAAELGIEATKIHMTAADWRSANRLQPIGVAKAIARCESDVIQNKEMHRELVRRGLLKPPSVWVPFGEGKTKYHA